MNKTVMKLPGFAFMSVAILILLVSALSLTCQLPGFSQFSRAQDFVIQIETEEERGEFEYKESRIGPVIKAKVTYYRPNSPDDAPPVHYETLWFHDFQTLGCRKYNELEIDQSGQVAIEVKHKRGLGSLSEGEAAAKAVLWLFVDVYAMRHSVTSVIVPDDSMGYILNQMPRAGFNPGQESQPDVPVYSPIVIPIRSTSGSNKQILYYTAPPDAEEGDVE